MDTNISFVTATETNRDAWWLEAFADHLRVTGRSERTVEAYVSDVRSFALYFEAINGEPYRPELTNGVDLRAWREVCVQSLEPATWNRRRAALMVLCGWLMDEGTLAYDPMAGVTAMQEVEKPPRWLDEREWRKLARQVEIDINGAMTDAWRSQAIRDGAMIGLMALAGLREGEVTGLDVRDVQMTERSGRVVIRRGKGDKKREVPLGKEARRALQLWLVVRGDGPGALFTGKGTDGLSTRTIQRRVGEIAARAGLEGITPHDLRHTFAKRALDRGVPLTTLKELMGHKRLSTTARYVQPGWGDFEHAVEGL